MYELMRSLEYKRKQLIIINMMMLLLNQVMMRYFLKLIMIFQNEGEPRQEQSLESSVEPRVEIETPTSGKNMINNHPSEQIIKRRVNEELCLISQVEPKNADEACKDDCLKQAMKEELDQIENNGIQELVPRPTDKNVVGTKWVFKNKMNEQGEVVRNKGRLVCKGYLQ